MFINKYKTTIVNIIIFLTALVMLIDYHPTKLFTLVLFLIWIFNQNKESNLVIIKDKIAQSAILLFSLFLIGVFWSDDSRNAIKILERESLLLLSPLLVFFVNKNYLKYIVFIIFSVIFISELVFLLEYYNIADFYYREKTIYHYPFIHRMYFTTILAFSIGYTMLKLDLTKYVSITNISLFSFIFLSTYTLFLMGGRSGYINFFVVLFIISLYKLRIKNKINILFLALFLLLSPILFYNLHLSSTFNNRVDKTIESVSNFDIKNQAQQLDSSKRTSLSCRLEFWYHASKIIEQNPFFGVGTGDGVLEMKKLLGDDAYAELKRDCGLNVRRHFNTHNLYINILLMFGVFGLSVLFYFFYLQLSTAKKYKSINMIILIVPTMITMLSQSALFTSHYFISFYSFVLTIIYLEDKTKKTIQSHS